MRFTRYAATPEIVLKAPTVKFLRKYWLDPDRLPPFAYHGCTLKIAKSILSSGSRPGFSVTGNRDEAISYAFQRTEGKVDGAVLRVKTSFITPDVVGDYYDLSGANEYLYLDKRLPASAFSLDALIPIKEVMTKHHNKANKITYRLEDLGIVVDDVKVKPYDGLGYLVSSLPVPIGLRKLRTFTIPYTKLNASYYEFKLGVVLKVYKSVREGCTFVFNL